MAEVGCMVTDVALCAEPSAELGGRHGMTATEGAIVIGGAKGAVAIKGTEDAVAVRLAP